MARRRAERPVDDVDVDRHRRGARPRLRPRRPAGHAARLGGRRLPLADPRRQQPERRAADHVGLGLPRRPGRRSQPALVVDPDTQPAEQRLHLRLPRRQLLRSRHLRCGTGHRRDRGHRAAGSTARDPDGQPVADGVRRQHARHRISQRALRLQALHAGLVDARGRGRGRPGRRCVGEPGQQRPRRPQSVGTCQQHAVPERVQRHARTVGTRR